MFIHLVDETVLAQIFKKYCESDQIYVASRVCSRWRRLIFEKVDISLGVEERKIEWMICNDDDDVKSDPTTKCPLLKVRDEYGEHHIENYDSDTKVVGLVANATSNDQIVRTCVNNNTMNFKEESCSEWLIRELYNSFTYIVDSIISDEILNNNESVNSEEWNSSADEDDNNCDFRCECRKVNIEPGDMKISQCCGTTTCSCFARNLYCGMHFRNYNSTLNLEYNYPIYECNDNCECNPNTCRNRILPFNYNGSVPMDLYLFLKNLKIGLGVKCKRRILKGEFICEYIGEILSDEEANTLLRSGRDHKDENDSTKQINDMNSKINKSHTYLLIVEEHFCTNKSSTEKVTNIKQRVNIDASRKGNISRFLNHSCEPNLTWRTIRTLGGDDVSSQIPRVCFFALNDIEANIELTFDYGSVMGTSGGSTKESLSTTKCYCGSSRCRGFLPFTHVSETD